MGFILFNNLMFMAAFCKNYIVKKNFFLFCLSKQTFYVLVNSEICRKVLPTQVIYNSGYLKLKIIYHNFTSKTTFLHNI